MSTSVGRVNARFEAGRNEGCRKGYEGAAFNSEATILNPILHLDGRGGRDVQCATERSLQLVVDAVARWQRFGLG
jgi:hypothetical protein